MIHTDLILISVAVLTEVAIGGASYDCTPSQSTSGLQCTAFLTGECSPVSLKQSYPHLYTDGGEFPERPRDFNVGISSVYYPSYQTYYPFFNITIWPPQTSSYKDIRGFHVTYQELIAGNTNVKCIIFNLTGHITTDDRDNGVTFDIAVGPVGTKSNYFLKAYSLPKPDPEYDADMYQHASVYTGMAHNDTYPTSGQWFTSITYKNYSQEIYFHFSSPPSRFNFVHYYAALHQLADPTETSGRIIQDKNITEFEGEFRKLSPGWYNVKIRPIDTFWQDHQKCLCKDKNHLCTSCVVTRTAALYIHPVPSTTLPPTTEAATVTRSPEDHTAKIVGAIVGSFLGIILIAVIILILFMYTRRTSESKPDQEPGKYLNNGHSISHTNEGYVRTELPVVQGHGLLKRKKVFLVNTEDHPKHLGVLKAFTHFLEKECRCDVTFAPNSTINDKLQWIIHSMDTADFILIVNSPAAYLQYKAWTNNKAEIFYQPLTKAGDIFGPALQQITDRIGRNRDVNKFISMQFPYTHDKFVIKELCLGTQYKIPTHLDEFLYHLHGLNRQQCKLEDVNLPLRTGIRLRPTGMILIDAINEAVSYEKSQTIQRNPSLDNFDSGIGEDEITPSGLHHGYGSNPAAQGNVPMSDVYQNTVSQGQVYDYAYQGQSSPNQMMQDDNHEYVDMQITPGPRPMSAQRQILLHKKAEEQLYEPWSAPDPLPGELPVYLEFHPPSHIGDEDVLSTHLRQEIHDINNRYMVKQVMEMLDSGQEVEECQSLGGMSV